MFLLSGCGGSACAISWTVGGRLTIVVVNQASRGTFLGESFHMSDHWNSLANLLGTPSLAPQNRKTDLAGASKTPPAALNVEPAKSADANVNSGDEIDNAEKPKQEKSRLKSSWDAVASFFGVAAPESAAPESMSGDVERTSSNDATAEGNSAKSASGKPPQASRQPAGKKSKPSMWGDEESVAVPVEPTKNELPRSAFEPRSESKPSSSRDREESSGREREEMVDGPQDSVRSAKPSRTTDPEAAADEPSDFGAVSDRRSNRRPPRRGRSRATSDEGMVEESASVEPAVEEVNADEASTRDRSDRRADAPRSGPRGGRDSRSSNRDRNTGDRPRGESSRGDSGRADSSRGEPRGEATERSERGSREGGRRSDSSRDASPRDAGSRDGNRRDESRRDEPRRDGAGARREEPSRDDSPRDENRREDSRRGGRRQENRSRDRDGEGGDRDNRAADRGTSDDRRDRSRGPRDNERNSRSQSQDRKPTSRTDSSNDEVRSRSGFGAGIHDAADRDDDFSRDEARDYEEPITGFIEVDDSDSDAQDLRGSDATGEDGENDRGRRPRRRRRRGGKDRDRSEGSGERSKSRVGASSAESAREASRNEGDEEAEEGIRHSKIPSWLETITSIVDSNIENHQRSQNTGRGGSRGRGRR